ncbi:hypothetical protein [Morganella morganii]|nr:hypothetical protein [Morganella morganii]
MQRQIRRYRLPFPQPADKILIRNGIFDKSAILLRRTPAIGLIFRHQNK